MEVTNIFYAVVEMNTHTSKKGVTLIETLLVMAIVATVMALYVRYMQQQTLIIRINRAAMQMQQILNAAMIYDLNTGTWPAAVGTLSGSSYISPMTSPWGNAYTGSNNGKSFSVVLTIPASVSAANATVIGTLLAGKLPFAVYNGSNTVTATITLSKQTLNSTTGVNYAGLYNHGACVPVPVCPLSAAGNQTAAQVFLIPVSVSGMNDVNSSNVYPISSYSTYAVGPAASPGNCTGATTYSAAYTNCTSANVGAVATNYWRACMTVITERGNVNTTNTGGVISSSPPYNPWGRDVTMAAFTRCAETSESSGSTFAVYSN